MDLARKMCQQIAEICPEGIGSWEEAWDIVVEADADFSARLRDWEQDPTAATGRAVSDAHDALLDAWREAVRQYNWNAKVKK